MAYIRKRGNSYQITVTFRPSDNLTAEQAMNQAERIAENFDIMCNSAINDDEMTLSQFCDEYLQTKKNILAEKTYLQYKVVINNLIKRHLGHLKLTEIKPIHVQQFVNILKKSEIKPATIKRKLAVLQSVLRLAVDLDLIEKSPVKPKMLLPTIETPETEHFSAKEMQNILSLSAKESSKFRFILNFAILTGARRGEIGALRYSDFNADENTVTISRSAYKVSGQPVKTKATKSGKSRTVAVSQHLIDLLAQIQAEEKAGDDDFIFTEHGQLIHPQRISTAFFSFLKRNGIKHRKFHALRHTSATLLLAGGIDINQVRERLGHGSVKTTQIYLHCTPEHDRNATDILRNMLIQRSTPENLRKVC